MRIKGIQIIPKIAVLTAIALLTITTKATSYKVYLIKMSFSNPNRLMF